MEVNSLEFEEQCATRSLTLKTEMQHNYFLRDHLGNTRVQLKQNKTTTGASYFSVSDTKDYYAFGLEHGKPWEQLYGGYTSTNPYLYNGKEMDRMHGLNQLDYGARWYDPSLGRWGTPDPLAEKYRRWSTYNYCMDNPIRFIDPDGMQCTLAEAQGLINWAKTSGDDDNEERINRGNDWLNMQSSLAGFDSRCFAGNKTGGGGGKKDAKKEEDKKIDENGNMDNKGEKGVIVSMINGSAAFGLGPTADIGLVTDSQKKSFYYLTFGYVVGLGASAGTGVTITNKYFKGIDIKGESVGFNITFPFFKGLFSGDGFFSSKITHGIGLNIGVGKGYFIPHTYTIIAPLPAFNDKNIYFSTYGH